MLTWLSVKIKFLLPLCFSIWHLDYSLLGKGKRKGQRWLLSCMRDFFLTSFKTMTITRAAFHFLQHFAFLAREPRCCCNFSTWVSHVLGQALAYFGLPLTSWGDWWQWGQPRGWWYWEREHVGEDWMERADCVGLLSPGEAPDLVQ